MELKKYTCTNTCSQFNTHRRCSLGWGRSWVVITPVPLPPQSSPLLSFCSTTFLSASGFHYKDIKLKSRRGDKAANWRAWVMTVYSTAVASLHAGLLHIASHCKKVSLNINTNALINTRQTARFYPSVSLFLFVVVADSRFNFALSFLHYKNLFLPLCQLALSFVLSLASAVAGQN